MCRRRKDLGGDPESNAHNNSQENFFKRFVKHCDENFTRKKEVVVPETEDLVTNGSVGYNIPKTLLQMRDIESGDAWGQHGCDERLAGGYHIETFDGQSLSLSQKTTSLLSDRTIKTESAKSCSNPIKLKPLIIGDSDDGRSVSNNSGTAEITLNPTYSIDICSTESYETPERHRSALTIRDIESGDALDQKSSEYMSTDRVPAERIGAMSTYHLSLKDECEVSLTEIKQIERQEVYGCDPTHSHDENV